MKYSSYNLHYNLGDDQLSLEEDTFKDDAKCKEIILITVKSNLQGFSYVSEIKNIKYVDQNTSSFIKESFPIDKSIINNTTDILTQDLQLKFQVFKPYTSSYLSEYTRREFVSPILAHAVKLVLDYGKAQILTFHFYYLVKSI